MDTRHTLPDGDNKNITVRAVGHEKRKRQSKYYPDVSVFVDVKPFTIHSPSGYDMS